MILTPVDPCSILSSNGNLYPRLWLHWGPTAGRSRTVRASSVRPMCFTRLQGRLGRPVMAQSSFTTTALSRGPSRSAPRMPAGSSLHGVDGCQSHERPPGSRTGTGPLAMRRRAITVSPFPNPSPTIACSAFDSGTIELTIAVSAARTGRRPGRSSHQTEWSASSASSTTSRPRSVIALASSPTSSRNFSYCRSQVSASFWVSLAWSQRSAMPSGTSLV